MRPKVLRSVRVVRIHNLTDRAYRYRANATPPLGEPICCLCGADRQVEVGHVDGHEENTDWHNLFWTCRRCNILSANTLRNAKMGRLTRQYNPGGAKTLGQWVLAVSSMKGESNDMSVADAVAMIKATSQEDRSRFASEIWRRRRKRFGKSGRSSEVPF